MVNVCSKVDIIDSQRNMQMCELLRAWGKWGTGKPRPGAILDVFGVIWITCSLEKN